MKILFLFAFVVTFAACDKSDSDNNNNTPQPGTTREFTGTIQQFTGSQISGGSTVCQILYAVEFDEDPAAVKYKVEFYEMQKFGGAIVGVVAVPNATVDVLPTDTYVLKNGAEGNITYTNYHLVGSGKMVTRKPSPKKVNVSPNFYCAGNGVCSPSNTCQTLTGKAKITVYY